MYTSRIPIRCPFEDNPYMSAVGLSLTLQICIANYLLLPYWNSKFNVGKPKLPSLPPLKTYSANYTSFSESCMYLFNKYSFIQ